MPITCALWLKEKLGKNKIVVAHVNHMLREEADRN